MKLTMQKLLIVIMCSFFLECSALDITSPAVNVMSNLALGYAVNSLPPACISDNEALFLFVAMNWITEGTFFRSATAYMAGRIVACAVKKWRLYQEQEYEYHVAPAAQWPSHDVAPAE